MIDTPALKAGPSFWFRDGIPDALGTSVLDASVLDASALFIEACNENFVLAAMKETW